MRTLLIPTSAALFTLLAFQLEPTATARGRAAVERDVEGYAVASCLARQKEPYLKEQARAWMDVIVQRSQGDVEHFKAVADAVEAQVGHEPMPMTRDESDPKHAKAVPVLLCAEIIDTAPVHAAIAKAIKKVTPAYRQAGPR